MYKPRRFWAFRSNPKVYRLEEAIKRFETDWWTTKRRAVSAGDRVLFWNVKGPGIGVIALGEVLTDPEMLGPGEKRSLWGVATEVEYRAEIRYVLPPRLPLLLGGPADAILRQLSVSRVTQGTVYNVTPEQWEAVVEAAGGWPATR